MKKIYFAGGWFDKEQEERHTRIYDALKLHSDLMIFNPRLSGEVTTGDTDEKFSSILKNNIYNLNECDLVVAITDKKDMGTIWETGYAYAIKKPIIYYCETLNGKPFNLMLAKTGLVATNEGHLHALLNDPFSYEFKENHAYEGDIE